MGKTYGADALCVLFVLKDFLEEAETLLLSTDTLRENGEGLVSSP